MVGNFMKRKDVAILDPGGNSRNANMEVTLEREEVIFRRKCFK